MGRRIAEELAALPGDPEPPRPPQLAVPASVCGRPHCRSSASRCAECLAPQPVGCDGVSLAIIRQCFAVLAPHILHVVNMSIVTGVVPADLEARDCSTTLQNPVMQRNPVILDPLAFLA